MIEDPVCRSRGQAHVEHTLLCAASTCATRWQELLKPHQFPCRERCRVHCAIDGQSETQYICGASSCSLQTCPDHTEMCAMHPCARFNHTWRVLLNSTSGYPVKRPLLLELAAIDGFRYNILATDQGRLPGRCPALFRAPCSPSPDTSGLADFSWTVTT